MFVGFEQITVSSTVLDKTSLTIPAKTTHAVMRVSGNHMRYTMDGTTVPTTTNGMLMSTNDSSALFLVDDLLNIKMIRDGASNATLMIHYVGTKN